MLIDIDSILSVYDVTKPICIDVETTSFDPGKEALYPYLGTKTTVIVIGQKGQETVALPIRHVTEGAKCLPLDTTLASVRNWAKTLRCVYNLNVKFDFHMLAESDDITFDSARMEELGALARLVHNDIPLVKGRGPYSLENLCAYFNVKQKESAAVKAWLSEHGTKDYGEIPLDILLPYAIADVDAAISLRDVLLEKLPEDSSQVWETECMLTKILWESERTGLHIDTKFVAVKRITVLQQMIVTTKEIEALSGITNPDSDTQVRHYFNDNGIKANKKTETGEESFDKYELEFIANAGEQTPHKVAALLRKYSTDKIIESTFCAGWMTHTASDGRMHPSYRQAGTVSGRSSSGDPNVQNIPDWLMRGILIPKGRVGVTWDLSQIEYRLFAHYSQDEQYLSEYAKDPWTDYHQIIADILGLPRKPVKSINFGILYGMGKRKLKNTLRKDIVANDTDALREHLYANFYDPFEDVPKKSAGPIPDSVLETMADNILAKYHELNPSIKQLQQQIKSLIGQRGYLKGYYGRRFKLTYDKAYIGLNRVIQGSAADLFKSKIVALFSEECKAIGAELKLQIHDAVYADMPISAVNKYWDICNRVVTSNSFRVPVLMDGKIAMYDWGNTHKIPKNTTDLLPLFGYVC